MIITFFSLCFPHTIPNTRTEKEKDILPKIQSEGKSHKKEQLEKRNDQTIQPTIPSSQRASQQQCHWNAQEILMHRWLFDAGTHSMCVVFLLKIGLKTYQQCDSIWTHARAFISFLYCTCLHSFALPSALFCLDSLLSFISKSGNVRIAANGMRSRIVIAS